MGIRSEPSLSVVIPVLDERDAIEGLLDEVVGALRGSCSFELIVVDDGSSDGSDAILRGCRFRHPELVVLRHRRRAGQSAALLTGIGHARADWVATLDGDGQNDPADLPRLLAERARLPAAVRLLAGHRVERRDSLAKRIGSWLANAVRGRVLGDRSPDTGCGTKLFERRAFLALPRFAHMHRFLPALFRRDGWEVANVPVNHRPRRGGRSKYGNLQRLAVGLVDLLGVWWLLRRRLRSELEDEAAPRETAARAEEAAA